ncbi:hypothetical protein [Nocardioides sp.]|uniref:hypothetical protein n=1 Tax=Nocardioides sp. TaxID=35761 RepID=UPI00286EA7AE|nr:hypothetical protein [Nocardioides sp.]
MSFELVNLTPLVFAVFAVAGLAALLALAAGTEFFASNRKVRVARHESIPAYYGNLLGAH